MNPEERFLSHMFSLYMYPEIRRRVEVGSLPGEVKIWGFQVLFQMDNPPMVRINKEVRGQMIVGLKEGKDVEVGERTTLENVDNIESIRLEDDEEPKYAHFTAIQLGHAWTFTFDFRYDKGRARKHLAVAKEFLRLADYCYRYELWHPFAENLLAALELMAKADLMLLPETGVRKARSHKYVKARYNLLGKLGNENKPYCEHLNKLWKFRKAARYLEGRLGIDTEYAKEALKSAREMSSYLDDRVAVKRSRPDYRVLPYKPRA